LDVQALVTQPFVMVGKGSNMVIDPHFSTRYAQLSPEFSMPQVQHDHVTLPASMPVHKVMQYCVEQGLSGLEFMAGVPASVGGMVSMNFGCWGHEVSHYLQKVRVVDHQGEYRDVLAEDLEFAYRSSLFQRQPWVLLEAVFALKKRDPLLIKQDQHQNIQHRLLKQPLRQKTFGSIFKNPPGHHAAKLIEVANLKGAQKGDAMISDQHANFMLNLNQATFEDVYGLIKHVIDRVYHVHQVLLEPEVKLISKEQF